MAILNRISAWNLSMLLIGLIGTSVGAISLAQKDKEEHPLFGARQEATTTLRSQGRGSRPAHDRAAGEGAFRRDESSTTTQMKQDIGATASDQTPRAVEVSAPTSDGTQGTSDPGHTAVIRGRVLHSSGNPLVGCKVVGVIVGDMSDFPTLNNADLDAYADQVERFARQVRKVRPSATSDMRGEFELAGLDPRQSYDISVWVEGQFVASQSRVAAGDSIELRAQDIYLVRGRVHVLGPRPELLFVQIADGAKMGEVVAEAVLEHGVSEFTVAVFKPGNYRVFGVAPGFYQPKVDLMTVSEQGASCEITLEPSARLSGVVRDGKGRELANVTVALQQSEARNDKKNTSADAGASALRRVVSAPQGAWVQYGAPVTFTNSRGVYAFDSIPPGEYTALPSYVGGGISPDRNLSQVVVLKPGDNRLDLVVDSKPKLGLRSSTQTGAPVQIESMALMSLRENGRYVNSIQLPVREAGLREYVVEAGEYEVTVNAKGFLPAKHKVAIGEDGAELSVIMTRGAVLTGTVDFLQGITLPSGGLYVRLVSDQELNEEMAAPEHKRQPRWVNGRYKFVRDDTRDFFFGPVETGVWQVQVILSGAGYKVLHQESCVLNEGSNTMTLSLGASLSFCTLELRLQDEQGAPMPHSSVSIRKEADSNAFETSAMTNKDGVANMWVVDPGEYTIGVYPNNGTGSMFNQTTRLAPGANTLTITIRLPNCVKISEVGEDTQAGAIGLLTGDIILSYDGVEIRNLMALLKEIRRERPGVSEIPLVIERDGVVTTYYVKPGKLGINGQDSLR